MFSKTQAETLVPDLDKIFRAKSVAVIGASPKVGTARNRVMRVLLKHGYTGRVYPVTPSNDEVEGLRAYRRIEDLPEIPDVALIITPAETVAGIIEECGQKGIRCAIVLSAGFEEIESGRGHASRLRKAAFKCGVTVLGPNCQGVWSVRTKTMLNFSAAAYDLEAVRHAPIAIISQSGALAGAMGNYLQKNQLGCSYIVSVGNETCLDALDVLGWIIKQDDVRVVGLYLEGLANAGRLLKLAAEAHARGVQIVTLKAGRSAFGQEATASHTGKIASPYGIYVDVLEQAGVAVMEGLTEMMAALEVLCFLPNPRVSSDKLGGVSILSSSGGAGALLADHSDEHGVPMAIFSDETSALLEKTLPEFARKVNPIDLTGQIRAIPNLFPSTLAVLLADQRTEAVVVQFASSGLRDLFADGDVFKAAARDSGLPMIISLAAERADIETRLAYLEAGVLVTDDPLNAMRALKWLYDRKGWSTNVLADRETAIVRRTAPVSWEDTMSFLDDCAVPAAPWKILGAGQSAVEICAGMTWPLVVKALPSEAEHKTELGLVKLRVQSFEDVELYAAQFRKIVGKPEMGVLVQEMITDGVEVVLSCLRDTDFGPVLSIGSGGVAIELYRDITYLALPVTPQQVEKALRKLKLWTSLEGFRGAPRADIEALIQAAVKFGNTILATPDLSEAEINPVLVRPAGKGVVAVDFLAVISTL